MNNFHYHQTQGIDFFNSREYDKALLSFSEAVGCLTKPVSKKLRNYISKTILLAEYGKRAHYYYENEYYEELKYLHEDLISYGITDYNKKWKEISFEKAFSPIQRNGKYGFLNSRGETVIDFQFHDAFSFHEGLCVVLNKDGKCNYIDRKGNFFLPTWVDFVHTRFFDDRATIQLNGRYGFINRKMKTVVDCKYENARVFSEGLAEVVCNNRSGFIDRSGKLVIPCRYKYEMTSGFSEGLAAVVKDKKYGFINKSGEVVFDFKYDVAGEFSEGLACVNLNGKNGYIDKEGNFTPIDIQFSWASGFQNGAAAIEQNGKYYLINKKGTILCPAYGC